MTQKEFEQFEKIIKTKGYQRKKNEFVNGVEPYYWKCFGNSEDDSQPSYIVRFLIKNHSSINQGLEIPMICADSHEWASIEMNVLEEDAGKVNIDKVEKFAHDFYFNFVLVHGL